MEFENSNSFLPSITTTNRSKGITSKLDLNLRDQSHWLDLIKTRSHPLLRSFREFRVRDDSLVAYLVVIALCLGIFVGFIRHAITSLPTWNYCTAVLLWSSVGMLGLLFLLVLLKFWQYKCYLRNNRVNVDDRETNNHTLPVCTVRTKGDDLPAISKKSLLTQAKESVCRNKQLLRSAQKMLENIILWLSIIIIEYYVVYLVLLKNYWRYEFSIGDRDSNIPTDHSLPEGILAAAFFLPISMYFVFKHVAIRMVLLLLVMVFLASITLTGHYNLHNSVTKLCLAFVMSLFITLEYHRQCWFSFITSLQLQDTLSMNMKMAEEMKAKELRHMLGNVAHDLKTPLSSFISGIDVVRSIIEDLQRDIDAYHLTVPDQCPILVRAKEKAANIIEVAENVTNTNIFMIMTINRCIDYNKTLFGVKLVAKLETILLRDCMQLVLNCIQSTITNRCHVDCSYLSDLLHDGAVSMRTDKQWLLENLLCLLSNAVKYSRSGSTIRLLIDVVEECMPPVVVPELKSKKGEIGTSDKGCFMKRILSNPRLTGLTEDYNSMLSAASITSKKSIQPCHIGNSKKVSSATDLIDSDLDALEAQVDQVARTSVSCKPPIRRCIRFMVVDHGPGIAEEFLADLFKEPAQTARLTGGTGLGLYSLAKRVETMGGQCGVSNLYDHNKDPRTVVDTPSATDSSTSSSNTNKKQIPIGCAIWFTLPWNLSVTDNHSADHSGLVEDHRQTFATFAIPPPCGDSGISQDVSEDCLPITPKKEHGGIEAPPSRKTIQYPLLTVPTVIQEIPSLSNATRETSLVCNEPITVDSFRSQKSSIETCHYVPVIPIVSPRQEDLKTIFPRVLVVDDSATILKMTSLSLTRQGHEVFTAENGLVATELCIRDSFDVILMDFQMPIMNGIEAIKAIRELERTRFSWESPKDPIVIIGFSAKSDEEQIEAGYHEGMDYFLPKPFLIKTFHELLSHALMNRRTTASTSIQYV